MTTKAERKEQSRGKILASVARLVRERGIAGTRVADVMEGAGLTVGGFYAHFESKDALVDEAIKQTGASLRERLFAKLAEKPPADRAVIVLKRYLSAVHRDEFERGCPLPAVVGEIGTVAPAHARVLSEQIDAMSESLAAELPHAGALPRRTLALGLVALMVGGLSLARALRGTELSDEVLTACRALGILAARGDPHAAAATKRSKD